MANVVVHVTGSIAAFKAVTVVRMLQKSGHQVRVVMTKAATELVGPATFASLTHYPVLTDLWTPAKAGEIPHIELADWADYSIVVPASANTIAKLANGIADNPVTTTILATTSPVMVVPAMNNHMWHHAATQRNVDRLRADGVLIMNPAHGRLAEGYAGDGRMPEPDAVVKFFNEVVNQEQSLAGQRVIVTLGGTVAPIDPVRYIGNWSSGKMGWAIAQAAYRMGANVQVIAGKTSIALQAMEPRLAIKRVQTSQEMFEAIQERFQQCDVLVMAAAVADFKVTHYAEQKIKKVAGKEDLTLHLKPDIDILKTVGASKTHQITVGFAAETQAVLQNAQQKLANKHADMIVANDVSRPETGFNVDQNQVAILRPGREPEKWPVASKQEIGQKLMQLISTMIEK